LPGTPDSDLADADVHARYLAGERAAVTAGDHREVPRNQRSGQTTETLTVSSSAAISPAVRLLAML